MAEVNNGNAKQKRSLVRFLREAKSELKKVTWPTKGQVAHNTLIILVFIVIVAVILSVLDIGFSQLLSALTSLFA